MSLISSLKFLSVFFFMSISLSFGLDCAKVKHWGFICASDTETAICGTLDGINYIELNRESCPSGLYCNEEFKNCTSTPNMKSSYAQNFNCPDRGYYPNLGNCENFIYCDDSLSPISLECPSGKIFSTKTNCCTETLTAARCNQREIGCKTAGDIGAIADDNRYFYFCLMRPAPFSQLYPQVMKCPNNQVFYVNRCVEPPTVVTASPTDVPGTSPITTPPIIAKCTPGTFERIIDDCRSYRYCDNKSVWYTFSCGSYAYFDNSKRKCIVGKC